MPNWRSFRLATKNYKEAREALKTAAIDFLEDAPEGAISNVMALHSAAEHAHDWERRMTTISLAQKGQDGYMEKVGRFPA